VLHFIYLVCLYNEGLFGCGGSGVGRAELTARRFTGPLLIELQPLAEVIGLLSLMC